MKSKRVWDGEEKREEKERKSQGKKTLHDAREKESMVFLSGINFGCGSRVVLVNCVPWVLQLPSAYGARISKLATCRVERTFEGGGQFAKGVVSASQRTWLANTRDKLARHVKSTQLKGETGICFGQGGPNAWPKATTERSCRGNSSR